MPFKTITHHWRMRIFTLRIWLQRRSIWICIQPCSHTLGAAAFLSYIIKNKRITIYLFTWAFIVCYSRIYLGVHYLGDVICGGILGAAIGYTTAFAINSIIIRYITWKHLRSYKAQLR